VKFLTRILLLTALATVVTIATEAASHRPYFPTDLILARAVQGFFPIPIVIAKAITATAEVPWCFVLLGLSALSAWMIGGRRSALLAVPVFFGPWLLGIWLSPRIAQPRPSPELIAVIGHPKGYAFPSIFGLVYATTFGYVGILGAKRLRGVIRAVIPAAAGLILMFGACARIVLGAHWPSDLWVPYLVALFWIELLLPSSCGASSSNLVDRV
jgi:membrane-associated phospholipid phosphatase